MFPTKCWLNATVCSKWFFQEKIDLEVSFKMSSSKEAHMKWYYIEMVTISNGPALIIILQGFPFTFTSDLEK